MTTPSTSDADLAPEVETISEHEVGPLEDIASSLRTMQPTRITTIVQRLVTFLRTSTDTTLADIYSLSTRLTSIELELASERERTERLERELARLKANPSASPTPPIITTRSEQFEYNIDSKSESLQENPNLTSAYPENLSAGSRTLPQSLPANRTLPAHLPQSLPANRTLPAHFENANTPSKIIEKISKKDFFTPFSGEGGSSSLSRATTFYKWEEGLLRYLDAKPAPLTVGQIRQALRGSALEAFQLSYRDLPDSAAGAPTQECLAFLRKRYCSLPRDTLVEEWKNFHPRQGEIPAAFLYRADQIRRLWVSLEYHNPPTRGDLIFRYITHWPRDGSVYRHTKKCIGSDNSLSLLKDWESEMVAEFGVDWYKTRPAPKSRPNPRQTSRVPRTTGKCQICAASNHATRDCTHLPRFTRARACTNCGWVGHSYSSCRKEKRDPSRVPKIRDKSTEKDSKSNTGSGTGAGRPPSANRKPPSRSSHSTSVAIKALGGRRKMLHAIAKALMEESSGDGEEGETNLSSGSEPDDSPDDWQGSGVVWGDSPLASRIATIARKRKLVERERELSEEHIMREDSHSYTLSPHSPSTSLASDSTLPHTHTHTHTHSHTHTYVSNFYPRSPPSPSPKYSVMPIRAVTSGRWGSGSCQTRLTPLLTRGTNTPHPS